MDIIGCDEQEHGISDITDFTEIECPQCGQIYSVEITIDVEIENEKIEK